MLLQIQLVKFSVNLNEITGSWIKTSLKNMLRVGTCRSAFCVITDHIALWT